jgi:hypothetical protein
LVPVGCGVDIATEQMVPPEEYERILKLVLRRSLEGGIEMKATWAPHYFRVVRQRRVAERRSEAAAQAAHPVFEAPQGSPSIGPTEMAMPGSTGIELKPYGIGHAVGHPGTHPSDMNAMTKGCLAEPQCVSFLIKARFIPADICRPWLGI